MHHDAEVRLIAYQIWESEGRPDGKDLEHWYQAEAIWAERQSSQQAETPAKPAVKRTRRTAATRRRRVSRRPSKRET